MLHLSAKRHRSIVWWEDAQWKTFWATIKGPIILFGSLVEYHPITSKDQSRIHQFLPSLCYWTAEKSEGTLNASHSFTGYEPKVLTFGELTDSSVLLSLKITAADQDVDDVTLGKMLTEAHRGQADYCVAPVVGIWWRTWALGRHCLLSTTGTFKILYVNFSMLGMVSEMSTTLSMNWTCMIFSTVFGICGIMGICVASKLTSPRYCHCAVLVRCTSLCLFTEMLITVPTYCNRCISNVMGERFGLLENFFVTYLAHWSLVGVLLLKNLDVCLSNWLIFACRIVVGSKLRVRHCLEALGFVSCLARQLIGQMCWLWIEFSFCLLTWLIFCWTIAFSLFTVFLMISDNLTSTVFFVKMD